MAKPPKIRVQFGVRLPKPPKPKRKPGKGIGGSDIGPPLPGLREPPPKLSVPRDFVRDSLADAFRDGDLVGSENELTDFDGASFGSGGNTTDTFGGGSGADPLAGDRLAAFEALTKPTRRIGRKKSDRAPSRSRVY